MQTLPRELLVSPIDDSSAHARDELLLVKSQDEQFLDQDPHPFSSRPPEYYQQGSNKGRLGQR